MIYFSIADVEAAFAGIGDLNLNAVGGMFYKAGDRAAKTEMDSIWGQGKGTPSTAVPSTGAATAARGNSQGVAASADKGARRLETVATKDGGLQRVWKGTKNLAGNALNKGKELGGKGIDLVKNNKKAAGAVLLGGTLVGAGGAYLVSRNN